MSDVPRATPIVLRTAASSPGRNSIMAIIGMIAGAVPLPFVPSAVLKRIRGALAHDVATRYGLCLTQEARDELSAASRTSKGGAFVTTIAFFARRTLRRVGALGVLPPLTAWFEVYALGHLFDRYLCRARASQSLRIHEGEAKRVRAAIDRAVSRALSPKLELQPRESLNEPTEELRNFSTRLLDGFLLAIAAVPDHLRRRLETAFDLALAENPPGA
ncbi:MAG: hypothetical protein ABW133_22240 [Polyangiaceae bacterium]